MKYLLITCTVAIVFLTACEREDPVTSEPESKPEVQENPNAEHQRFAGHTIEQVEAYSKVMDQLIAEADAIVNEKREPVASLIPRLMIFKGTITIKATIEDVLLIDMTPNKAAAEVFERRIVPVLVLKHGIKGFKFYVICNVLINKIPNATELYKKDLDYILTVSIKAITGKFDPVFGPFELPFKFRELNWEKEDYDIDENQYVIFSTLR